MSKPEQPTLAQLMEAQILSQKSWLLLAEFCYKPDRQETIECLIAAVGKILPKTGASTSFVEATQTMLSQLMGTCYDSSIGTTLDNMRDAFARVNAHLPAALEERYEKQETDE